MGFDIKNKGLYELINYPIFNNFAPKRHTKSLIHTLAIRNLELVCLSNSSAKKEYNATYSSKTVTIDLKNKEEWKQVIKHRSDEEILNIIFANQNGIDRYHKISPVDVKDSFPSIQSILQGIRPLASISGTMLHLTGLEEKLKTNGIGILKCNKTTIEDVEDGLEQKDFRERNYEFQLGDYRTVILYRPGHSESAQELAKTLLSTSKQDPYRFQRIGRLLFYKEEEIKNFCNTYKYAYTEGDLPPSSSQMKDSDYEITQ